MTVILAFDRRCRFPLEVGEPLGVGGYTRSVPPGVSLPDEGWMVIRRTWAGDDYLYPPVSRADIEALPDPGPDPRDVATEQAQQTTSVLGVLATTPIDHAELTANLDYLAAFVGNSVVAGVPRDTARLAALIDTMVAFVANDAPTNAEAIAAIKAVCENSVTVDRVTLAVLADLIRYTLQR